MKFDPRLLRRSLQLLPYLCIPAVGVLSPLLVIPAVTAHFGGSGWAAVAVGMSLGTAAATVAEQGWGVFGPQRVASLAAQDQLTMFRSSLASRAVVVAPLSVLAAAVAWGLSEAHPSTAACVAFGFALVGMSPSWFLVGRGEPYLVLIVESLPRLVAAVATAVLLEFGQPLVTFGLLQIAAPLVTMVAIGAWLGPKSIPRRVDWMASPSIVRSHLIMSLGRSLSVVFTAFPTVLLAAVSPPSVALFAAVDRLSAMVLAMLAAIPARCQSWIGRAGSPQGRWERARASAALISIVGTAFGLCFAFAAPWAANLIFKESVHVNSLMAALGGAVIGLVCASRALGLTLVAIDRPNKITWAVAGAATVFGTVGYPLATWLGAAGCISAVIVSQITGLAIQIWSLRRAQLRDDASDSDRSALRRYSRSLHRAEG